MNSSKPDRLSYVCPVCRVPMRLDVRPLEPAESAGSETPLSKAKARALFAAIFAALNEIPDEPQRQKGGK